MLRQIEWGVQNGPITKNTIFPVSTLFFWKFSFSIRTCYKKLISSINYPNVHIHTFSKRWHFIWECFFPVSLKLILLQLLETTSIRICHVLWEQFCCSCMYIKTARNKSQLFKETTWVVNFLHCWSACKCNDMQTWFSVLCWHIPLCF